MRLIGLASITLVGSLRILLKNRYLREYRQTVRRLYRAIPSTSLNVVQLLVVVRKKIRLKTGLERGEM